MSGGAPARNGVDAAQRERALAAVDALRGELVELAASSVRAPSVSGREQLVAPLYADWLEAAGFEVRAVHADPSALPDGAGDERDLDRRPNVYGRLGSRPGRPLLALNGHVDVVPAGDGWARDPFAGTVEDGCLWGRGAADMKGGLAAGMIAVRAIREAGIELACDVVVQCVIAEETGGLGTRFALASEPRPDAAIVLEPTGCAVASAAGGMIPFVVETTGRAVHSSVPWAGASALERLDAVRAALACHTRRRARACAHPLFAQLPMPAPLSIGVVRAGDYWASVPDRARMEGRLGVLPGETVEELCRELEGTVAGAAADHGCVAGGEIALTFPMRGFPAWETDEDEPVVAALRAASLAVAGDERATAVTYGSDAGRFTEAGVPVVLFGPGSIADAHGKDEHVALAQLHEAARILAVALLECSARFAARPAAGAVA